MSINQTLKELPFGFLGQAFCSPLPLSPFFDPEQNLLTAYLNAGVETVVMLIPEEEAQELTGQDLRKRYHELGLDVIYAPIPDFSVPSPGVLNAPIQQMLHALKSGHRIVIHCHAGVGRTGLFAACLAKAAFGFSGPEAITWVRQYIPDAVENSQQYRFVLDFTHQSV